MIDLIGQQGDREVEKTNSVACFFKPNSIYLKPSKLVVQRRWAKLSATPGK